MSNYFAVLLEIVSIQKYIFQSNKLKENLGASYQIKSVYEKYLREIVLNIFNDKINPDFNFDAWRTDHHTIQKPFDVGFIGGGNALLLFVDANKAKEFIQEWTKKLIINTPNITTAASLGELDTNSELFKDSKQKLFDLLRKNKSEYIPQTVLLRHGITSECTHSGFSQETWYEDGNSKEYVSASTFSKLNVMDKVEDDLVNDYKNILKDEFCFTNQLELLGQTSGSDSHIAIVHIDGNDMGERFKEKNTLPELREFSVAVDKATKVAYENLLRHIIKNYDSIIEFLGFDNKSENDERWAPMFFSVTQEALDNLKEKKIPDNIIQELEKLKTTKPQLKNEFIKNVKDTVKSDQIYENIGLVLKYSQGKKILPIRQIILGGDDVTFACDGKLGIYFAKLFIELFEKQPVNGLTACGGVAIIKTKYPFYRGYELAEELCINAKTIRKKNNEECSFIDFQISFGGLAGELKGIRNKQYGVIQGKLLFRPYKVISKLNDEKSFQLLIQNTKKLSKFPNSKIKELRKVLTLSKETIDQFVQEMKYRDRSFPEIHGRSQAHKSLFIDVQIENKIERQTPYFDMIELAEFYPLSMDGGE